MVYSPTGAKLATMTNATTPLKTFISLPGGGQAVYSGTALAYYRHADWQGSSRLATTPSRTLYFSAGYSPFGYKYGASGTTDQKFAGNTQDFFPQVGSNIYDTPNRLVHGNQARWFVPDPSGSGMNRYVYTGNNPVNDRDTSGLGAPITVWVPGLSDMGGGDPYGAGGGFGGWPEGYTSLTVREDMGMEGPANNCQAPFLCNPAPANNPTLPKCSSLGPVGVIAAGLSLASQWTGTGYTLGVNGNGLKAQVVGVDIAASVALVSDPAGNVGTARSLSVTPSVGARSYGGGIIIGGSTFSDLSGYSSYSNVNFTTTFGAGLATGFTESSNSSGLTTTAYVGFGAGGSAGAKGLSLTNNVQAFCKQ